MNGENDGSIIVPCERDETFYNIEGVERVETWIMRNGRK